MSEATWIARPLAWNAFWKRTRLTASCSRSTPDWLSSAIRAELAMASSASAVTRRPATALDAENNRPLAPPEMSAPSSALRRAERFAPSRLPAPAPAGAVAIPLPEVSARPMPAAPLPENSG